MNISNVSSVQTDRIWNILEEKNWFRTLPCERGQQGDPERTKQLAMISTTVKFLRLYVQVRKNELLPEAQAKLSGCLDD
jgi:hypothetical protein